DLHGDATSPSSISRPVRAEVELGDAAVAPDLLGLGRKFARGRGEPVGIGHTRPAKLQAKHPFGTQRDPSTHRDGAVFGMHADDARAAHLEALPNRYVHPGPQVLPAQHSHRAGRRTGPGVLTDALDEEANLQRAVVYPADRGRPAIG